MQNGPGALSAVDALRADHAFLVAILDDLSAQEWAAETGCPGWSVKDLVAHLATLFHLVVDPDSLPSLPDGSPTEQNMEIYVANRADWSPADVLADYVVTARDAFGRLDWMSTQSELTVPLGDLGTYPLDVVPTSFAFDHYTHIRADLLAPRGPIQRPAPPSDELRLGPTLQWVVAALPQQNPAALAAMTGAVELSLTGPAGGRYWLSAQGLSADGPGEQPTIATVACSIHDLVLWVTGRAGWDELGVGAAGEADVLTLVRDHIHVF